MTLQRMDEPQAITSGRTRILLIDDSADRAALLSCYLRDEGLEPEIERVDSRDATIAALKAGGWDLIVSEHRVPGFDGLEALACRNRIDPGVPFIATAGRLEHRTLVALMKSGADDIIEKRDPVRLVLSIKRAMKDVRLRRENARMQEELRQTEQGYLSLVDLAPDGIMIVTDGSGEICFANRALLELLGATSPDQVVGKNSFDFVDPDFHDVVRNRSSLLFEEGRTNEAIEINHRRVDGSTIATDSTSAPIIWDNRLAKLVVLRDITKRKRAERALRESEERYRSVIDLAPDGVVITCNRRIVFANPALVDMLGVGSVDELIGKMGRDFVHPGHRQMVDRRNSWAIGLNRIQRTEEINLVRADGAEITVEVRSCPFPWNHEAAVLVIIRDVSARERVEADLRKSETFLQTVIDTSVDGILTFDENVVVCTANPASGDIFDRTVDDLVGQSLEALIDDDVAGRLARGSTVWREECGGIRRDGQVRSIEYTVNEMPFLGRRMFTCIVRDVTELKESEQRYRSVVDVSPDGIVVVQDGKIVFVNPAFGRLLDDDRLDRLIGMEATDLYHQDDRKWILQRRHTAIARGFTTDVREMRLLRADGTEILCETRGRRIVWEGRAAVLVICRDVTERRRLEEERAALEQKLRQAQKMESLGTLAGGTAHELNNLLQPIMLMTELVKSELGEGSDGARNLRIVLDAARSAADIVDQILSFSRRDEPERKPVSLEEVFRDATNMLATMLPSTVELDVKIDPVVGTLLGDGTQLKQVLINLASNGRDAIGDTVGRMTIALKAIEASEGIVCASGTLEPGSYAMIAVSDTGCGIDPALQNRIFEPFYTTKGVGSGTGLGLAAVHGIVIGHGGDVRVESSIGSGTTFYVYLPIGEEDPGPVRQREDKADSSAAA